MSQENPFLIIKIRTLILWFLLSILIIFVLSTIVGIIWGVTSLFGNPDSQPLNLEVSQLLSNILLNLWLYGVIAGWCFFQMRRSRLQMKPLIGSFRGTREQWRLLFLVFPTLLFSIGSGQLLFYMLALIAPDSVKNILQNSNLFLHSSEGFYAFAYNFINAVVLIIVAPIIEEFLFRGIIFQRFAARWQIGTGIILSSLLFGILHLNPIGLSVFGAIAALLYLRTNTLIVPILFHAINNLIVAIISWATINSANTPPTVTEMQNTQTLITGLLFIVVSAPILIWYIQKNWVRKEDLLPYNNNLKLPALSPESSEDVQA
ncbi:MAG: CPBP family intramembrane glutamic endopeptidase [Jaaginema sp. PMC 1079.18]|nr:CPBP family intramembrane glutamic endopeptidase [Jaaginema sp. PMC 1080.18]MEC4852441.1 CPBP family intramembrane glutamic endopeptidase [Jaaginema sp. PMC 1079.18]MEC4868495.1 CPBP family intramembrane glutamic endopeptidase [Jaaginema sp. PMC 1078.18]